MVAGKKKLRLTAESILERVTEYDIYRYYMGENFKTGKVMQSPMPGRGDNHPSFMVGNRCGFLYHIDYADSRFRGNCFQFVMQKEMLPSYNDALTKIDRDFNLGISSLSTELPVPVFNQPLITEDTEGPAHFIVQYSGKFTNEELRYWEQYYITKKELEENEIFAIRKFLINRQLQPIGKGELVFGYRKRPFWKVYRPYACKRRKWQMNMPIDSVENLEALKGWDNGVVTKARKDRVVLQKFMPYVCSVQNESLVALNQDSISFLQENVTNIYINYDADEPGKRNSWKVTTEFGFKHLNVPDNYLTEGIKDFADLIKAYGPDKVYNYLQSKNIVI